MEEGGRGTGMGPSSPARYSISTQLKLYSIDQYIVSLKKIEEKKKENIVYANCAVAFRTALLIF